MSIPNRTSRGQPYQETARWARHVGAMTSGALRVVRADSVGNVIAAGDVEGTADLGTGPLAPLGVYDLLVAGFAAAGGATLFARRLGGMDYEGPYGIDVGHGGAIAIGGYFRGTVDLGTGPINGGPRDNGFVMMIAP